MRVADSGGDGRHAVGKTASRAARRRGVAGSVRGNQGATAEVFYDFFSFLFCFLKSSLLLVESPPTVALLLGL